jgi:hypothetical protein
MRGWILLPAALILGWGMGSWIPKTELRAARAELAEARKALKQRAPSSPRFTGVTQMLGIEEAKAEPVAARPIASTAAPHGEEPPTAPEPAAASTMPTGRASQTLGEEDASATEPSMVRNIEQAIELWDARVGIARATFVSNAGLTPEEAGYFDLLVDAMNLRIGHSIEQFVEHAKSGADVGEADGIRLARDFTSALAITYDEMDANMPEAWQGDAGKSFSLTDFVDPSVALPLTEVETELGSGFFAGGR